MLTSTLILVVILLTIGGTLPSQRRGGAGARRPYNNRYSDATAARDDRY
jgi:hypothetical protein